MENAIVVGLDIGTTKTACLIGKKAANGKIDILGYAIDKSVGMEKGDVINIVDTDKTISDVVRRASEQANVKVNDVYVGIAGRHIKSYSSQGQKILPPDRDIVTQEDIDTLCNEQRTIATGPGEEIIHVFPQTYYIDGRELDKGIHPVGVTGSRLNIDFHIVTGNKINIGNIVKSVKSAELSIKGLVLEPVASSLATLSQREKDAGVVLVDIGGGTTDIAIFHEGVIRHTSVLALAGEVITSDIERACGLLKDQAENLKVKFGHCLESAVSDNESVSIPSYRGIQQRNVSMKMLAKIINVRVSDIMGLVAYEIQKSGYDPKMLHSGLVLTGGGSSMADIKAVAELNTAMNTRIGEPIDHLADGYSDELKHPKYATGIGLVLYGLNEAAASNNHYIEEEKTPEIPETTATPDAEPLPPTNSEPPVINPVNGKDPFAALKGMGEPPMPPTHPTPPVVNNPTPIDEPKPVPEPEPAPEKDPKDPWYRKVGFWFGKFLEESDD